MNHNQVSKAQEVRDYYDDGLTAKQIADRMGINVELVEMVLDNYNEDWRSAELEGADDPMFLEYENWQQSEMEA